ncbi:MAG TPA: class F sortase [Candidatus Lumbricidophila sp.]|nr:class F sortase [Candidatus Lumbricidophila sp.]
MSTTPYVLPGWDTPTAPSVVKSPARSAVSRKPVKQKRRFGTLVRVLGVIMVVELLAVGGALVYLGISQQGSVPDAPVPAHDVSAPNAPVTGATGEAMVDTNAGPMSVEKMQPLHYFIPALGVYSEIVPMTGFTPSRYSGFDSLKIPSDPSKSAWYEKGGALADNGPGTSGTTLLASHITSENKWGVLKQLYTLKGGELIYVKDAAGKLSVWKVSELTTKLHTEFPQEYFKADGARQLVVTTCGEYSAKIGHYTKNIFAIAEPVDPTTKQPFAAPTAPVATPSATRAP